MPNEPPDYCPHCGGELVAVDPRTMHRCRACDELSFYNPTPSARVAVLDGDAILLCAVGIENYWETPGGRPEGVGEPSVAAARELREETGLRAGTADLELFGVRGFESTPDRHKIRLCYAVERSATDGPVRAGSEPADVAFRTVEEFAGGESRLNERQPAETRSLEWWVSRARDALS